MGRHKLRLAPGCVGSRQPDSAEAEGPRVAVLVGGDSRHFRFTPNDNARLADGEPFTADRRAADTVAVMRALGCVGVNPDLQS